MEIVGFTRATLPLPLQAAFSAQSFHFCMALDGIIGISQSMAFYVFFFSSMNDAQSNLILLLHLITAALILCIAIN